MSLAPYWCYGASSGSTGESPGSGLQFAEIVFPGALVRSSQVSIRFCHYRTECKYRDDDESRDTSDQQAVLYGGRSALTGGACSQGSP